MTRSRLVADLRRLGVREGGITMVHTRMSAIGHVVGAAETVVRALLEVLGPEGTLMAYASWGEHVYGADDRPAEHRYRVAMADGRRVTERTFTDIDTSAGAFPYEDLGLGEDPFAAPLE